MKKLKSLLYLIFTLLFTYGLSEILVYGSSYISDMVDAVSTGKTDIKFNDIKILCMLVMTGFLFAFFKGFCSGRFSAGIICNIKEQTVDSLLNAKTKIFFEGSTGSFINKLNSDINLIEQYLAESFPKILSSLIVIIIVGRSFYKMNKMLIIEVGVCCVFILGISFYTSKKLSDLAVGRKQRTDSLLNIADDFLRGIIIGRSYNLYPVMKKKIDTAADEVLRNEYHRTKISSYSWLLQTISEWLPVLCLIGIVFIQSADHVFQPGDITYMILMMNRLFKPFSELPELMNRTAEIIVSFQRVFEIMNCEKEDDRSPLRGLNATERQNSLCGPVHETDYAVEFENVTFSYIKNGDAVPILKGLNFRIKQGEEAAIVGSSGGGKSTVFKILCGFAEHDKGNYKLFGKSSEQYSAKEIRKQFAVVSQDTFLFPGTIYENIAYGNETAGADEIVRVCKLANIHEDIEQKPDGYNTMIGENGKGLSGGEKQRISLARALLKNAPVILLDEPTSALDVMTEQSIRQTLNLIKGSKTIIMIAHRLSTVEQADRILVISGGQLAESGTDDELMHQKGLYYHLKMAKNGE